MLSVTDKLMTLLAVESINLCEGRLSTKNPELLFYSDL
jgi:hypothetical protein